MDGFPGLCLVLTREFLLMLHKHVGGLVIGLEDIVRLRYQYLPG